MSRPPSRRLLAFAAGALLLWAGVLYAVIEQRRGGDCRALLLLGEQRFHPAVFAGAPRESAHGYDGQFYATVASDPLFLREDTRRGLDKANYRATRILIPAAAWVLGLGHGRAAIVAYQALCWTLAVAAVCLVAAWLERLGKAVWWAAPLLVSAGVATSILRSTPDAAALAFLLASLLLAHSGRRLAALALAVLATLARETFYLAALALAVDRLRRGDRRGAARLALLPLLLLGAWKLFLHLRVGPSINVLQANLGAPLAWLPDLISRLRAAPAADSFELWGAMAALATLPAVAVVLLRDRERDAVWLLFLAFGVLAVVASHNVYVEVYAYARVLIALPFLAVPLAARLTACWERLVVASVPLLYGVSGLLMIRDHLPEALARPF